MSGTDLNNVQSVTEKALHESQERYALAVAGSNDGLWDWNILTNEVYFAPRWKEIIGYEDHEIAGDFSEFESRLHPEDHDRVIQTVNDYLEGRLEQYAVELRLQHKDGSYRWILARGKALRNETGQPTRMAGSHTDISEQKRNEATLIKQSHELAGVAQISAAASTSQDVDQLLQTAVNLTKSTFGLYHAHIYLLNDSGDILTLTYGAGDIGRQMVEEGHTIPADKEQSLVARAARTTQAVIINDVRQASDFLPHPLLPETQAEMAVPLLSSGRVLGVLDIQSDQRDYFTTQDANIMTTLASQIGIAVENARRFTTLQQQTQALAEATTFLDSVVENLPLMLFVKDAADLRFVRWNKAGEEITGFAKEGMVGKNDYDFVRQEEADFFTRKDREVLNSGQALEIPEEPIETAHRGTRILHTRKVPLMDAQGNPKYLMGISEDITERKQIAENLAILTQAVESSVEPVTIADARQPDMPLVYVNEAFERITGYKRQDVIGLNCRFLQGDDHDQPGLDELRQALKEGQSCKVILRNYRQDGTLFWNELQIFPIVNDHGQITHFIGSQSDITERKQIEESLTAREAQLAEALKIAQLANWEYDVLKDTFVFNDQFYALLRTTATQEGGYTMSSGHYSQRFVYPDDAPLVGVEIGKALETTDPNFSSQLDHRVIYADGEVGYVTVRFRVQKDDEGRTIKTFGANQDITVRKQAEFLLEKQARELDAVAQISTAASTIQETGHLLQTVVDLTKGYFTLYHTHIYLLNEVGDTLVLTTGSGDVGRKMVAEGRAIPVSREQSLVARAARSRQVVIVNDVRDAPDFLPNPLLPDTRAEMAVPLLVGGRVLGVLDIQGNTPGRFTTQDANIMATLASQVGIALQNARSFEQYDNTLAELNLLTRRLTREGWDTYLQKTPGEVHYAYGTQPVSLETANGTPHHDLSKPLTIQGEIIGQLALAEPDLFDDEADEIMSAIAERLSTHLENLRLTDQTQYALAQTESLYSGSGRVVRAKTVQEVMEALVDSTALGRLDRANIVLYDHPWVTTMPNTGTVIAVWEQSGEPPRAPVGTVYQARQFPSIELFSADHPTLFNDVATDERIDPNLRSLMMDRLGMRCLLVFPFIIGGQWWGFISGQATQSVYLTDEEIRQITSLSEQAATVIQTLRLFEQATDRAEQLSILNEMARDLTIALDVESAMETIHHYTDLLMDARNFYIALYNNETQEISFPIAIEDGTRQQWRSRAYGNGLTEYVIQSGHGLLIKNGVEAWIKENEVTAIGSQAQSWLGMPLKLANIILGVVALQSQDPHVYDDPDYDLLSAVASQGSIAIQNARLFEQTQNALAETETLFDVSRRFNAANNPAEIALAVGEPVKNSGVTGVDLYFIETDSNNKPEWVELKAVVQYAGESPIPMGSRFYLPELPIAHFWLSNAGEPIFVEDVREEQRLDESSRLLLEMTGVRCAVYLPLTLAGRWVALIGFRWHEPHTFAPGDKRLYQSIAAQAAVSVNNYQLFDEAQERAKQLEVLTRVETELSQATNEQEILRALLSYVDWGEPYVSLSYLREDDNGEIAGLDVVSAWKKGQFIDQVPDTRADMELSELPLLQLWQENEDQILLIGDVTTDPRTTIELQEQAKREGDWRATTLLPLRSGGRWQAIVGLTWYEPHRFSVDEMFFFERLQEPIAAAIAGRRAFVAQQSALAETEALYRATRDLNTAKNYDEILATLRDQTIVGDNALHVSLNYFDVPWTPTQTPEWIGIYAYWSNLPTATAPPRYHLADFPSANTLLHPEKPLLVENVDTDPRLDDNVRELYSRRFGAKSTIFVPMLTGGEWIGYINAIYPEIHHFPADDVQRLMNVASQAAAAVQNIALAEKREQALQETATLYQATAEINASRRYYEIITILRNYTLGKHPVKNITLNLFDRPWSKGQMLPWVEIAERLHDIGEVPVGSRFNLSEFPSASLILSQEEPIFISDLATDSRIDPHTKEVYHDRLGANSIIFIPLLAGGQWLGFVDVFYAESVTFEEVELRRMLALTGQAAVATQNLRSVEVAQQRAQEAQARREESELLYNLSAQLTAANTLDDVLRIVTSPASDAGARSGVLALFTSDDVDDPTLVEIVSGWSVQKQYLLAPHTQWMVKENPHLQFLLRYPRSPLYVHDVHDEIQVPSAAAREFFAQHGTKSLICLPLNIGRRRLGIILLEWNTQRTFSNTEQRLYHSIAGQASVVVDNRQLLMATQTRAAQLDKLSRIETALSIADTEEEILLAILPSCNNPFAVSLQYIETDRYDNPQALIVKQMWQAGEFVPHSPIINQRLPILPDSRLWIEKPNEVLFIEDVDQDERLMPESRNTMASYGLHTMATLPLRSSGRWQGIISFTWAEGYAFSADEKFIWRRLLDALGAVVASRRALVAQQAAREETERLYNASRRLNEATDISDMLGALVTVVPNSIINRAVLMLFEYDEQNELVAMNLRGRWYAGFGTEPSPIGTRYSRDIFAIMPIVLSQEPIFIPDIHEDPRLDKPIIVLLEQLAIRAMGLLPLWVGSRQIGCVLLEAEEVYEFQLNEMEPYTALAGQLAIAVENQRLFDQTRQQLSDLTAIQETTSLLTAAPTEQKGIEALLAQVAKAVGVEVVNLYMLLDADKMIRAGQYASIPVPEFPEHEVLDLADYPMTREVITTRQPTTRLADDPRLTDQSRHNLSGRTANATIPLVGQDKVMGILSVNSYQPDYVFTPQAVRLLQTLAEQATIALERVRLLEETTRRARREQILREITSKVRGASDVETVMRTAVHEVGRILGRRTFVHLQNPGKSD